MKPTLFKQLSEENQQILLDKKMNHLIFALKAKYYPIDITIGEMYHISEALGTYYGVVSTFDLFE